MMSAEEKAAWLSARAGKLTASRMADAMAYLKNGQPMASRTKLLRELLAERLTGQSVPHVVGGHHLAGANLEQRPAGEVHAVLRPAMHDQPDGGRYREGAGAGVGEAPELHEGDVGSDQQLKHAFRLALVRC